MLRVLVAVAAAVLLYRASLPDYDPTPDEPATGRLPAALFGLLVAVFWPLSLALVPLLALLACRLARRPERRPADQRRIAELEAAVAVPLDEVIEQIERRFDLSDIPR